MTFKEYQEKRRDIKAKIYTLEQELEIERDKAIADNAKFQVDDDVMYNGRRGYIVERRMGYCDNGVLYNVKAYKKDGTRGNGYIGLCDENQLIKA